MLRTVIIGAVSAVALTVGAMALQSPGVSLSSSEAQMVIDYYAEKGRCAPGRRGSDCARSSRRGASYEMGKPLSRKVVVRRLPDELTERLPTLAEGYSYAVVDGDLGIVQSRTQILMDVVSLG